MTKIRDALTRKFGPLPAWAWAILGGAALFFYRSSHGQYIGGADAGSQDTSPTERPDPVTLSPGESVYDPASGQLVGTAPEQQPPDASDNSPLVLKPGEGIYDPATGQIHVLPKPKTKRKPKPKPHHKKKPPHATPPHAHKPKPHGASTVRHPVKRAKHHAAAVTHKVKSRQTWHPAKVKAPAKARIRAIPAGGPALKQHTQATHPAPHKAATAHPKATPRKRKR